MSEDLENRRRAIYTGLKPYLSRPLLEQALEHWEQHYARSPRFALQRFVREVCELADLRERRSDLHLNLVQAMNMPAESLLDDAPARTQASQPGGATRAHASAFGALLQRLLEQLDDSTDHQLRLDLLASLRREQFPEVLLHQLQRWLLDREQLDIGDAPLEGLRAIVNRAYVLLAQYQGPVVADQVLHQATADLRNEHPDWVDAMAALL